MSEAKRLLHILHEADFDADDMSTFSNRADRQSKTYYFRHVGSGAWADKEFGDAPGTNADDESAVEALSPEAALVKVRQDDDRPGIKFVQIKEPDDFYPDQLSKADMEQVSNTSMKGITAQNSDVEAELLQARIRQQKNQETRDRDKYLKSLSTIFLVEGYERNAHSAAKKDVVGSLKEAKALAIAWAKQTELRLTEIYVTKMSRPKSYPYNDYNGGYTSSKGVAALKRKLEHIQDYENGPIKAKITWEWEK